MAFDNTNSGALFKNDRKDSEKQPDYKGSINANGTDFWMSAWIREKDGKKYMSISITQKDGDKEIKTYRESANPVKVEEEDLPF